MSKTSRRRSAETPVGLFLCPLVFELKIFFNIFVENSHGSLFKSNSIESLVQALGKGSVEAFDRLYRQFRPKVDRVAAAILGSSANEQLIKDLAQEIFLKVWEKRTLIAANVTNFDAYLFKMTKYEVLNYVQRQVKEHEDLNEAVRLFSSDDVQTYVEGKEAQDILASRLETLPPQRKRVFELSRLEHLSNKEIAEKMGISTKTVERHITMALQDLKKFLN